MNVFVVIVVNKDKVIVINSYVIWFYQFFVFIRKYYFIVKVWIFFSNCCFVSVFKNYEIIIVNSYVICDMFYLRFKVDEIKVEFFN